MKKYLSFALLMGASLFLAACTSLTPETTLPEESDPVITDQIPPAEEMTSSNDSFEGLTVEMAESMAAEKGVPFRIVMQDGEPLPATMDYRPGRINATVEQGVVIGVVIEGMEDIQQEAPVSYDQDSWKTMIPESCESYFDGCNNCRKEPGSDLAACTRMFCQEYQAPKCLDESIQPNPEETMAPSETSEQVKYSCAGDNTFSVFYNEYVSGDSILRLNEGQIMLSDTQDRTSYLMERTVSASGEKYESADGLIFWTQGSEATVWNGEDVRYSDCVVSE